MFHLSASNRVLIFGLAAAMSLFTGCGDRVERNIAILVEGGDGVERAKVELNLAKKNAIAPLIVATVMREATWKRLSPEDRATILEASREAGRGLDSEIAAKDREATDEMLKRGLKVTSVPPAEFEELWRPVAEDFARRISGRVPPELMELALRHRAAFREKLAGGPP